MTAANRHDYDGSNDEQASAIRDGTLHRNGGAADGGAQRVQPPSGPASSDLPGPGRGVHRSSEERSPLERTTSAASLPRVLTTEDDVTSEIRECIAEAVDWFDDERSMPTEAFIDRLCDYAFGWDIESYDNEAVRLIMRLARAERRERRE